VWLGRPVTQLARTGHHSAPPASSAGGALSCIWSDPQPGHFSGNVLAVNGPHVFWVDDLGVSDDCRRHIAEKHELTADQVRSAVRWVEDLVGSWSPDEMGRLRAIVDVTIDDQPGLLVMYPATGEPMSPKAVRWRLRTVYLL